jgi:hypothetical protein
MDHVVLPFLALFTAIGVMLITISGSLYGTGLPFINVVLMIIIALIWIANSGGGSSSPYGEGDGGMQSWPAAIIGALIGLAYSGTFVLFRAALVQKVGTILTLLGDTMLLGTILIALRVYFYK